MTRRATAGRGPAKRLPQPSGGPGRLPFCASVHVLSLIRPLEPCAQLPSSPTAVCRDGPVARDSGPAAASAAPPFSTREQGRLDGAEKSPQRGTLAVTSVVLRTRKLTPASRHRPTPQSPGTRRNDSCAQGYLPVPAPSRLKPASGSLLRSYLHTCMSVTCSHHTCPHSQE